MANEFVARKGIISIGVISGSGNLDIIGSGVIGGNLIVGGTLTAQEFRAELVSSSIIYESGSTKFGDTLDDEHQRTGSYFISGTAFTVTSSNFNLLGSFNQNGTSTISGQLNVDQVRLDDSTVTTNDASNLTLSTNVGSNSGTIVINHSADGNIVLTPNGTGIVDIKKGLTISGSTILGDSTSDSVTFNTGINTSPGFTSGFTGGGWRLSYSNTSSSLELDNLTVRGTMRVYELLINQIRATNGTLFVSSVGKVETVSGGPTTFFLTFDTGSGGTLGHGFLAGDIIRAQRVNPGNPSSFVYRSDMTVTGITPDGKTVTASLSGSSTPPSGGFEFVRLGNTTTGSRQGTVYLTADDTNAPFIDVIDGVTSHADWNTASGSNRLKTRMGRLNGISSSFGLLTGYGFYASGSAYLEGGINAAFGKIANWEITTNSITSSNIHLSSSNGGTIRMGSTLPASHTSGTGIFLSGSGQALIGSASGARIQFDGSNLILSSSTFLLGDTNNLVSGSGGNIRISGSNVNIQTPSFLLGNASNFVSGSGGNIRISGSNVQIQTPSFYLGGANQFISGAGGNIEISSSNFHLLNGNLTASNGIFSGQITATTGSFTGNVNVGSDTYVIIGPNATAGNPGAGVAVATSSINPSFAAVTLTESSGDYLIPASSSIQTNFTGSLISQSSGKRIIASGSIDVDITTLFSQIKTLDGKIIISLYRDSTPVSSVQRPFSYIINSIGTRTITGDGPYELFHTILDNNTYNFSIRSQVIVDDVTPGTSPVSQNVSFGTINGSFLLTPPPNLAIRNSGIFVNYSDREQSLLDIALAGGSGGSTSTGGGGGGGTVTSITAGAGLLGGTIVDIGTISLDTGSAHFVSGARKTISVTDTTGASGIDLTYNNGTGVLSGTLQNSSLTVAAGSGLAGGGSVSLGGTTTLTVNSGSMLPFYSSSIFSTVSGDITINAGGTASIAANSVALGTDTTGNYVATLGTGTGVTIGSNTGEGSTPTIAVNYGSTSNTAVQGNTNITISGTTDEIEITGTAAQALGGGPSYTIGLPNSVTITNNLTVNDNAKLGNATSDAHTVTGSLGISGSFNILQSAYGAQISSSIANTVNAVVASIPTGSFNGVFFDYTIGLSTTGRRVGTVLATWLPGGTNVEFTDFSTLDMGATGGVSMAADISAGNIRLRANNTSGNTVEVRAITRAI